MVKNERKWLVRVQWLIDRENGVWSEFEAPLVDAGIEENQVYDTTTDTAQMTLMLEQMEEPAIEIGTWVNVAHFNRGEPFILEFDAEGIPTNHNQYVVADVNMRQSRNKKYWTVALTLAEPIEWLKGVPTDTYDHSNQTEKRVSELDGSGNLVPVVYRKDPLNCLSVLERELRLLPITNGVLDPLHRRYDEAWYSRILILDREFLKGVPFSDDTHTAADLYTNLFKLGDVFDRTPIIYFDILTAGEYKDPILAEEQFGVFNLGIGTSPEYTTEMYYLECSFDRQNGFIVFGERIASFVDIPLNKDFYRLENSGEIFKINAHGRISSNQTMSQVQGTMYKYTAEQATEMQLASSDRATYRLKFQRRDGAGMPVFDYNEFVEGNVGLGINKNLGNYATGVVSEVNNLTTGGSTIFPAISFWAAPEFDSDDRDASTSSDNVNGKWFLKMPTPIKRVKHIQVLEMNYRLSRNITDNNLRVLRKKTDFPSENIMENQEYISSPKFITNKNDLIHYSEGDNKIFINSYTFFTTQANVSSYIYLVEYDAIPNVAMQYGDGNYIVSINQNDSQAENYKYSLFMENYLKGMGKADIIVMKMHYHYNEMYPHGAIVQKGDDDYIVTNRSYKCLNSILIATYQLNLSHYRRNINVRASQQIRPNRTITYDNLKDRRTRITDKVVLTLDPAKAKPSKFINDRSIALSALLPNQVPKEKCPQVLIFTTKSILKTTNYVSRNKNLLYPLNKQINSRQIEYTLNIDSNAEIGKSKDFEETSGPATTRHINNIKYQTPILYTDPFGEVQRFDLLFSQLSNTYYDFEITIPTPPTTAETHPEGETTVALYRAMAQLPLMDSDTITDIRHNEIFNLQNIHYDKSLLEKTNINYIVAFESKDTIICQPLVELSRLNMLEDSHTLKVCGYSQTKREDDLIGENELFEIPVNSSSINNGVITLNFSPQSTENLKSVVIFTNNNENLLILNKLSDIMQNIELGKIVIH